MEAINRKRSALRRQFERMETEFSQLLTEQPINEENIQAKHQLLNDTYTRIEDLDNGAFEIMLSKEATKESEDAELNEVNQYKMRMELIKSKMQKIVKPSSSESTISFFNANGDMQRLYNLPRVELKKFSGKLTDWLGFWAQFGKIHEDKVLHQSDKFYYLMQSLEPGSEPHQLVSGYPLSGENYEKAVSALRRRYGDDDILLQVYIRELLGLVISNVNAKDKVPFQDLFLKLDAYLRSLKTLNLAKADPATWLFPLVESSLPEDVLYSWQRSTYASLDGSKENPPRTRLEIMMEFMEKEVQIRQRIEITKSFNVVKSENRNQSGSNYKSIPRRTTAVVVDTNASGNCIFCGRRGHQSKDCFKAQRMPHHLKIDILKRKHACFNCFENHVAKKCDAKNIKCDLCGYKHHSVICKRHQKQDNGNGEPLTKRYKPSETLPSTSMEASNNVFGAVSLQTLFVNIVAHGKIRTVRAFLDSGSQRSYLLSDTAKTMCLEPKSEERVIHSLFGGAQTEIVLHQKYDILVRGIVGRYQCHVEVRDQKEICKNLTRPSYEMNEIMEYLQQKGITLSDVGEGCPPIELLLGADIYGKILTGRVVPIKSGPVAVETRLGWTLIGVMNESTYGDNLALSCLNMSVSDSSLSNLWDLELIGIKDPIQVITAAEKEERIKADLVQRIERDSSTGRYEVKLPWKEGFPFLPRNRENAERSLERVTRNLIRNKLFDSYGKLFDEWEHEGFIERVPPLLEDERGYYLPHRAVVKSSSLTTPVRPVFNASSRSGRYPSLNDCLEKGSNFILRIPEVLIRFREKPVAFLSDIRKAFQMIGVHNEDRNFMRFLWWSDDKMEDVVEYRHARVPFGAICSPFILGAVLEFHLRNLPGNLSAIGDQLLLALYVDNCVYSLETKNEYYNFRTQAIDALKDAAMDLRLWVSNIENLEDVATHVVPVLGLLWNRKSDELYVDSSKLEVPEKITKRTVLSTIQKIFDPIGFTCPAILPVKLILQRSWLSKLKWDEELPIEERKIFTEWCQEFPSLKEIRIKRSFRGEISDRTNWDLHTFTDASKVAYAAAVFLRVKCGQKVSVQLLAAKSRIAPVGGTTIPRMELLGCLMGARLAASVKAGLNLVDVKEFYWSDSTTALTWIRRNDQWGTFVGNRTDEIRRLTNSDCWRFVPGEKNPADLPSRGCSLLKLSNLSWWVGPEWLALHEEFWPNEMEVINEEDICMERKKCIVTSTSFTVLENVKREFSYRTLVRITGWVRRFLHNYFCRGESRRIKGQLQDHEIVSAESALIRSIQKEYYSNENARKLNGLEVIRDDRNVLRVKTRLTYSEDEFNFKYPYILPGRHEIVQQLIWDTHRAFCHAGVGFLVAFLRRKYWIVHARQSIRHVISRCYTCRRYSAKGTITETVGLPQDRIRNGEPFEITGIDLAGPFILKNNKKTWMILYTCALYRAVHLELIDSLSTKAFIRSLERFIKKFRRPTVIYTDNGTNFKGADNLFRKLNWDSVTKDHGVSMIQWKFNPSTASWWGGWWERLIRSVKDLVRRALGKAQVNKKEMETVIGTIEEVMNGRPLTYLSEDPSDLEALTPNAFIHPFGLTEFPEVSQLIGEQLRFRFQYVKTLQRELRQRWRREYLSMLVAKPQRPSRKLIVGELVVVNNESKKRHEWDLARIIELYPGKDGVSRVAKIRTADGEYIRPVQRLHALEMDIRSEINNEKAAVVTRAGRLVKPPTRF